MPFTVHNNDYRTPGVCGLAYGDAHELRGEVVGSQGYKFDYVVGE